MMLSSQYCETNVCVHSSRMGDVDDFPDVRVDAASPGPRVTFNIQDPVNENIPSVSRSIL